jgi:hypothetical protein
MKFYFKIESKALNAIWYLRGRLVNSSIDSTNNSIDRKILPSLYQKLTASKDNKIYKVILAIQAKCEFYNYDIFCLPPASQQSSPPSLTVNIKGDYVAGDKTQGDKLAGSKTENHYFPNATEGKIFEHVDKYYQSPPKDSSS